MFNTEEALKDLLDFASKNGIRLTRSDVLKNADTGRWARTSLEADPPTKKNVSLLIFLSNGVPNANIHVYGRAQSRLKWVYRPACGGAAPETFIPTPAEVERYKRENEARKELAAAELQTQQETVARGAASIWHEARKSPAALQGYLMQKGLPSGCAYVLTGAEVRDAWRSVLDGSVPYGDNELEIIVPLTDGDGKIWNVQRIRACAYPGLATNKLLLKYGRKKGLFCEIREPESSRAPIVIAEGWATAVSISLAVPAPIGVYMGIDKDNLLPAAMEIQRAIGNRHPVVFAGDNDCETEGNPGKAAALKAAEALHGVAIIPETTDGSATDWNDIYRNDRKRMLNERTIEKALEEMKNHV